MPAIFIKGDNGDNDDNDENDDNGDDRLEGLVNVALEISSKYCTYWVCEVDCSIFWIIFMNKADVKMTNIILK